MSDTLTGKEIIDLCRFLGCTVSNYDDDVLETEITMTGKRTLFVDDDESQAEAYNHTAYFSEYPEEGSIGLGDKLKPLSESA